MERRVFWSRQVFHRSSSPRIQLKLNDVGNRGSNGNSNLVSENKSSLPNENLNQDSSDLDDEIPF